MMMIESFLVYLKEFNIKYKVTNGYENIINGVEGEFDYDFLFEKQVFKNIQRIIDRFGKINGFIVVQMYHQGEYAKNFFLYDPVKKEILNLDLYGELARQQICILKEVEVFENETSYAGISILQPPQEFIQYFIKKLDKGVICKTTFTKLTFLFNTDKKGCSEYLGLFFKDSYLQLLTIFDNYDIMLLNDDRDSFKKDFLRSPKTGKESYFTKLPRIFNRLYKPTGISIAFLGPDGSGKSTIIDGLLSRQLPFRREDYFHLKPIIKTSNSSEPVSDPHAYEPYNKFKSYIKLLYFIYQYNMGWIRNIFLLKRKSSLIIFDRYFDDMIVDFKRYRYGGNKMISNLVKYLIPRPSLYFILTADADVIYERKQEVPLAELERQIKGYRNLADGKRYIDVDVSKSPEEIVDKVFNVLMQKMNERY